MKEKQELEQVSFPCPEGDLDDFIFAEQEYSPSER